MNKKRVTCHTFERRSVMTQREKIFNALKECEGKKVTIQGDGIYQEIVCELEDLKGDENEFSVSLSGCKEKGKRKSITPPLFLFTVAKYDKVIVASSSAGPPYMTSIDSIKTKGKTYTL